METIIRWLIKTFLKGWHLHRDPYTKILTAVVEFPKEAENV